MKKLFLICFTLLAGILVFSACHSEAMGEESGGKGELNLASMKAEVNTEVETVYLGSRAESGVDFSNYVVTIYDAQSQQVEQWKYGEMPEIISLSVGTYTVNVASAEAPSNGFDTPYYEGSATCTIEENKIVDVPAITCKLSNMLFTVEYDENFKSKMSDDVVTTITVGENSLEIPATETRSAYLVAPEGETTSLTVDLEGTIDGETITYSERFEEVKTGVHNVIKYEFVAVNDGTGDSGEFKVMIAMDSSLIGSDEVVGVNPGEEPGIEDFPVEGGEDSGEGDSEGEQNAPTIAGANFNGGTFDINKDVLNVSVNTSQDNPIPLQVSLLAPNGIAHVYVTIDSETLTADLLSSVDLAASFDLAEPGALETGLNKLGFPTGDAVVGQTEILFDITNFTPLLGLYGVASHNFIIRLVDKQGLEVTQTLKIKSVE